MTIVGDLVLKGVVSHLFTCSDCRFEGAVRARNVSFRQRVNLGGSEFRGPVDFGGSRFQKEVFFGSHGAGHGSSYYDRVNFSLAVFEGRADFTLANFIRADFTDARFRGEASFTALTVYDFCRFDGADFAGVTSFHRAEFLKLEATFFHAEFHSRTDFRLAAFHGGVDFPEASFADASFVGAVFAAPPKGVAPALAMPEVNASGTLDFGSAVFDGGIDAFGLSAGALVLDPSEVTKHVRGPEANDVLRLIESSARDRQDFSLANNAFYERQIVLSRHYRGAQRVLDIVFYRTIAGYFVRPLHPVFILLVLIFVVSLIRAIRSQHAGVEMRQSRLRATTTVTSEIIKGIERNFLAAVRWRSKPPPGVTGLEVFIYRLLVVCALVGLYANPSFRQIFEFLRS